MKKIMIILIFLIMVVPIRTQIKNGDIEYTAILYKYTKIHRHIDQPTYGYENGWKLKILGFEIASEINTTIKPFLFERNEIIKVVIDNYSQYNNYFEYTDKDTIDRIYNLFKDLETNTASTTPEPDAPEELYKITFFNDEKMLVESDNDIFKAIIYVYRKDNKYYAEENKNGIYEIAEETFNIIKSYVK